MISVYFPRWFTATSLMVVMIFSFLVMPVEARHNDDNDYGRYSSATSRAIENLDEDVVEEFVVPVLFGLLLKNIVPDFGDPRDGGARSHEGQDMMAPKGTPIISPTDAVVTSVGTGESSGKYVYTANPGGESFRYMHLDEIADIQTGDVLEPGDFIGTVGNTGNASGGAAHLHFEIKKGEALDPYPRMTKEYTLKEKMAIVTNLFRDIDDEEDMAEFLVDTFPADFASALASGYSLPTEIKDALSDRGVVDTSVLQKKLAEIIASIPSVVVGELGVGSTGPEVALMQFFLIYENTGVSAVKLSQSGATGYFGPVTEAAFREYQLAHDIASSGRYDRQTRSEMMGE